MVIGQCPKGSTGSRLEQDKQYIQIRQTLASKRLNVVHHLAQRGLNFRLLKFYKHSVFNVLKKLCFYCVFCMMMYGMYSLWSASNYNGVLQNRENENEVFDS